MNYPITKSSFTEIKGMAHPACRALAGAVYTYLEELVTVGESDLKGLHGMGPKALRALSDELKKRNLSFKAE